MDCFFLALFLFQYNNQESHQKVWDNIDKFITDHQAYFRFHRLTQREIRQWMITYKKWTNLRIGHYRRNPGCCGAVEFLTLFVRTSTSQEIVPVVVLYTVDAECNSCQVSTTTLNWLTLAAPILIVSLMQTDWQQANIIVIITFCFINIISSQDN